MQAALQMSLSDMKWCDIHFVCNTNTAMNTNTDFKIPNTEKVQIQMTNTNIDAAGDWVQQWSDTVFTSYRLGRPHLISAHRPTVQIQIQKVQIQQMQNDKYQLQTYKYKWAPSPHLCTNSHSTNANTNTKSTNT